MSETAQTTKKMPYVRLGKSGLKVSKIILGCMSYGDSGWQEWVLGEKEGIEHIKFAYALSIRLFALLCSHGRDETLQL